VDRNQEPEIRILAVSTLLGLGGVETEIDINQRKP
jgi:hypothetical protein